MKNFSGKCLIPIAHDFCTCLLHFGLQEPEKNCSPLMTPCTSLASLSISSLFLIRAHHSTPWILPAIALSPSPNRTDSKIMFGFLFSVLFLIAPKTWMAFLAAAEDYAKVGSELSRMNTWFPSWTVTAILRPIVVSALLGLLFSSALLCIYWH